MEQTHAPDLPIPKQLQWGNVSFKAWAPLPPADMNACCRQEACCCEEHCTCQLPEPWTEEQLDSVRRLRYEEDE